MCERLPGVEADDLPALVRFVLQHCSGPAGAGAAAGGGGRGRGRPAAGAAGAGAASGGGGSVGAYGGTSAEGGAVGAVGGGGGGGGEATAARVVAALRRGLPLADLSDPRVAVAVVDPRGKRGGGRSAREPVEVRRRPGGGQVGTGGGGEARWKEWEGMGVACSQDWIAVALPPSPLQRTLYDLHPCTLFTKGMFLRHARSAIGPAGAAASRGGGGAGSQRGGGRGGAEGESRGRGGAVQCKGRTGQQECLKDPPLPLGLLRVLLCCLCVDPPLPAAPPSPSRASRTPGNCRRRPPALPDWKWRLLRAATRG